VHLAPGEDALGEDTVSRSEIPSVKSLLEALSGFTKLVGIGLVTLVIGLTGLAWYKKPTNFDPDRTKQTRPNGLRLGFTVKPDQFFSV
jgi:hypothetical protein